MRARRVGAALVALALVVTVAACGDDKDKASDGVKGSDVVDVAMVDYAYQVSGPLNAGGTVRFHNDGTEMHMAGIGKLKPGKTFEEARKAILSDKDSEMGKVLTEESLPGNLLMPGNDVEITAPDLGAGTYVMICYMPRVAAGPGQFQEHFKSGMISPLYVTSTKAKAVTGDVKLDVTPGKAISGPTTLSAGHHVFDITVPKGSGQLEPILVKTTATRDTAATVQQINDHFSLFDNDKYDSITAQWTKEMTDLLVTGVHDLRNTTHLQIGHDFSPGQYTLLITDTDNGPPSTTTAYTFTVS